MELRWDVVGWAAVALLLFAAEALAPGAFMLWMGLAAAAVFVVVLLVPDLPLLAQVAAEALAPGAFMLWMGLAAAAVFLAVLLVPGIPLLAQVAAFVVLSFVSIQVYRKYVRGRGRERESDRPTLNKRAYHHVGRVVPLEQPIVAGRGRVKIGDAFWTVQGPELPAGTPVRVTGTDGEILQVEPEVPSAR